MSTTPSFPSLHQYVSALPAFSDHEHHKPDEFYREGMSLDKAFGKAYVAWTGYTPDGVHAKRREMLDHLRCNSYFHWFERGVQKVHNISEPITLENWDAISEKMRRAYADDPEFHLRSLRDHGFRKIVQDTYWDPGSDLGHPDIFPVTYRVDKFMWGFHSEAKDQDGFSPWRHYGFSGGTLDDWVDLMRERIRRRHAQGGVAAFKCAEAYTRTIDFLPDDRASARMAFGTPPHLLNTDLKLRFGNYVFHRACELAEELNLPFQIHTGLAQLHTSQPMNFEPIIWRYPKVRFVLFHSGFPWIHQISGIVHNHQNAYPSLTWTATISTTAAVRALHEYLDVTRSFRNITWGSDSFVPEDSVGALLAWRWIVAAVLAERVDDGRLRPADAEAVARALIYENGKSIYGVAV